MGSTPPDVPPDSDWFDSELHPIMPPAPPPHITVYIVRRSPPPTTNNHQPFGKPHTEQCSDEHCHSAAESHPTPDSSVPRSPATPIANRTAPHLRTAPALFGHGNAAQPISPAWHTSPPSHRQSPPLLYAASHP